MFVNPHDDGMLQSIMGQREIRGIANDPDDKNVINVDNVDGLSDIIPGLIESICNSKYCLDESLYLAFLTLILIVK